MGEPWKPGGPVRLTEDQWAALWQWIDAEVRLASVEMCDGVRPAVKAKLREHVSGATKAARNHLVKGPHDPS